MQWIQNLSKVILYFQIVHWMKLWALFQCMLGHGYRSSYKVPWQHLWCLLTGYLFYHTLCKVWYFSYHTLFRAFTCGMYFSKVPHVNGPLYKVLCKVPCVFHTTCKRCGQRDPPLNSGYDIIVHTQGILAKVPHVNVA